MMDMEIVCFATWHGLHLQVCIPVYVGMDES